MATAVKARPAEKTKDTFILSNISWETYESLVSDKNGPIGARVTYDGGMLQLMSPGPDHEVRNRKLAYVIETLAVEWNIEFEALGSTTFKRADLFKGFEPDSCFYIQNVAAVRGKKEIDLLVDPPPDLVIEIDITNPSLDKFPIFAAVGVPEVWQYRNKVVTLFERRVDHYIEADHSQAFPTLTSVILTKFLDDSERLGRVEWARSLRAWAKANPL